MNKLILILIALIPVNTALGQVSFIGNGQNIKSNNSWYLHLSDFDKDGDLDAYFENALWTNNGKGEFKNTGKRFTKSYFPNFADVNNDGLDDIIENDSIFLNKGDLSFTFYKHIECDIPVVAAHLYDLNNDQLPDLIACSAYSDRILINNGDGVFVNTGDSLGGWGQCDYAVGDINGDGYVDIYTGIPHNPPPVFDPGINKIWYGSKQGKFTPKEHHLDKNETRSVFFVDVDLDKDLDLFLTDRSFGGRIFFNDGKGNLTDSGQKLGEFVGVANVADFDNDGDIDLFICEDQGSADGTAFSKGKANKVWLNNGNGFFMDSGLRLGNSSTMSVAVGDLNLDKKMDVFAVNVGMDGSTQPPTPLTCDVEIWINNSQK